ncbi:bZIP transcription factor 12-like [Lolium rigidum]|uniref:bZIP transcription factor 12-like n=1 Tax=Lolium rigidum TaxID=89674 RepID=UPI001F5C7810|nr:bZIP transcription factor 12-like [Lolium rigidum]
MASSKVSSSSPVHTASDLARFAGRPGGGSGMGSMNVEELLRGIYGDIPATPAPDRPTSPVPPAPRHEAAGAAPRTAVEVWKEITGGSSGGEEVVAGAAEMTLEDFLARESAGKLDAVGMPMPGPSAALEEQVALGFQLNGEEAARGGGRGKKRQLMDPMDRAAMQRQKRMIKNRESAARSRERKQAYIAELESLVTQLEQENANLSKEQEEATQKRLKELKEKVTPVIISKTPSQDLRRTNSMEW